jgi:hypothetical protein
VKGRRGELSLCISTTASSCFILPKKITTFARMKKILIIAFLFTIYSCREDPTQIRQRDLIPKRKLVSILTEMHLMDALANNSDNYLFFPHGDSINIYNNIYKKYKVTSAEFDTTISMYSRRPDLFVKIYNDVILRLNYISDTLNNNNPKFTKDRSQEDLKK